MEIMVQAGKGQKTGSRKDQEESCEKETDTEGRGKERRKGGERKREKSMWEKSQKVK